MREFRLLREGAENAERRRWERARWQMFLAMQLSPYVRNKPSTPEQWAPFGWERQAQEQKARTGDWSVSGGERRELDRIMDEFIKTKTRR